MWLPFLQNDEILNMYHIQTGRLKLQRNTLEGSSVILHVALSGTVIAKASLFSTQYRCSAIADTTTEVNYVKKTDLIDYLEKNPIAMRQLLPLYAHEIINLCAINEIKSIHSAKDRTLAFLNHEMNANKEVHLSISLKDAAYYIGLSHETFYRTLKSLEKANHISRHGQLIKLL